MQTNHENERLYTLDDIMMDLAVAGADTPLKKLELRLRQLSKLEKEGWPQPQSMDAILKLYEVFEKEGMQRGFHYPVFCPEFGKEMHYSRYIFLLETGTLIKDADMERVKNILTIAENRQVTSKIAYRWHHEKLQHHMNAYVEGYDPEGDDELCLRLRFLHDLEIVMFRELFEQLWK